MSASEVHNRGGADVGEEGELTKMNRCFGISILSKPNLKWEDVAVVKDAKDELKKVILLQKFPNLVNLRPQNRILLHGPPGTGKSSLAEAAATKTGSTFFSISSVDLVSTWVRRTRAVVSQLFARAQESSPSIIFIDEIDALCGKSGANGESEAARCIKEELSKHQDSGCSGSGVLVLAATTAEPSALKQMERCFDKKIHVPLPDDAVRAQMLRMHIGETRNNLTHDDYLSISAMTEGFSGYGIKEVARKASYEPIHRANKATHFLTHFRESEERYVPCSPDEPGAWPSSLKELEELGYATRVQAQPVTIDDFQNVLLHVRPTDYSADLELYDEFRGW